MKKFFYLCLGLFVVHNAFALSSLDGTLFSEFILQLDEKKALFKQTKFIPELDLSFVSEGSIYFEKGKGVLFHQTTPEEIKFVTTKENYCIQDQKRALSELPHYERISNLFDLILSGKWEEIEKFFNLEYAQNKDTWHIGLSPTNKDISRFIKKLDFVGTRTDLIKIEIYYTNDTQIILDLTPAQKDETDEINC